MEWACGIPGTIGGAVVYNAGAYGGCLGDVLLRIGVWAPESGETVIKADELGLVYRRLGRFKEAEAAYMQALTADPAYAPAYLNLGVLCDLFLQDPQRALQSFEKYQELSGNSDKRVATWIAELKGRLGSNSPSQTADNPE